MKFLSTALFAASFVLFLFCAESFISAMNTKVMFWDHYAEVLNREIFMNALGWGITSIFFCFVSYSLVVVVMLAINLAHPNYLTKDRLDLVALSHLLFMFVVAIICLCGIPVYQLLSNSYILDGLSSFLVWYMAPIALSILVASTYTLAVSLKCFIKSFKFQ